MNKFPISPKGLEILNQRLHQLKTDQLKEALEMIQNSREKSDLTENSDYEIAKELYNNIQSQIVKISRQISNSKLILPQDVTTDSVKMLTQVKVKCVKTSSEFEFSIVSPSEIDPKKGLISYMSPVAKALIGKKKGETAMVRLPQGTTQYEIIDILPI